MNLRCGHPDIPANVWLESGGYRRCRQCRKARLIADPLAYRVRILPGQLERARMRVVHLEREAARLGLNDLLATHSNNERPISG